MADRPRVVHLGPRADGPGGIARVISLLVRSTLSARYDLKVVGSIESGSPLRRRLFDSATFPLRALTAVADRRSRLVHVHLSRRGSVARKASVVWGSRLLGRRVVVHVHSGRFDEWSSGGPGRRRLVRSILGAADAVIVLSPEWAERLGGLVAADKLRVVSTGVELPDRVIPAESRAGVVFLGALTIPKGVDVLLESVGLLQTRGVRLPVTLAGEGDEAAYRSVVAALPWPEDVRFTGWLGHEAAMTVLSTAAVFCLPSRAEGLPVALLEAMAAGAACVATPVGAVAGLLESGVNGLLVPPGDAVALAGALERLGESATLRAALGKAARATVEKGYSSEAMAKAVEAVYTDLGVGPGGPT